MGTLLFFCFAVAAVLLLIILPTEINVYKKYKSAKGNVNNTDALMRNFCYFVPHSEEEIRRILRVPNIYDDMKYTYDDAQSTITFQSLEHGGPVRYSLCFTECSGGLMLKVSQIDLLPPQNNFPYLQNVFWSKKINARPRAFFSDR